MVYIFIVQPHATFECSAVFYGYDMNYTPQDAGGHGLCGIDGTNTYTPQTADYVPYVGDAAALSSGTSTKIGWMERVP